MSDTDTTQTPSSSADSTPTAPAPAPRGLRAFARGPTAASSVGEADSAEPEQSNPADDLVEMDYDAAMGHSSEGTHRGTINTAKSTAAGNGVWIGIRHEDGAMGGLNFNLRRVKKDDFKRPIIDPKTGKPVTEPDVHAQKDWAVFARALGHEPKALIKSIVDHSAARTGDKPPIVGIEAVWEWTLRPGQTMHNATLNLEATAALFAAQGARAAD